MTTPSKTALRKLNKDALLEQALALKEQLDASAGPKPETDDVSELKNMVLKLTAALAGAQADLLRANQPADVENVEVTRVGGSATSVRVPDEYGREKVVFWESLGQSKLLTKKQVQHILDSTQLFEKGVLSCPAVVEDGANTIRDLDDFIMGLAQKDINKRIEGITSLGVLQSLYNHIENKRFTTVGVDGKDLRDDEGLPIVQELELPANYTIVERAVTRKLHEMQNVRASTEDIE